MQPLLGGGRDVVESPGIGLRDRALFTCSWLRPAHLGGAGAETGTPWPLGDSLKVLGKGKKERVVPLLPV